MHSIRIIATERLSMPRLQGIVTEARADHAFAQFPQSRGEIGVARLGCLFARLALLVSAMYPVGWKD